MCCRQTSEQCQTKRYPQATLVDHGQVNNEHTVQGTKNKTCVKVFTDMANKRERKIGWKLTPVSVIFQVQASGIAQQKKCEKYTYIAMKYKPKPCQPIPDLDHW